MTHHCLLFSVAEFAYLPRSTGVHRIATWLRSHDFDVEVVDWVNHWTVEQLKTLFKSRYSTETKFIGFSHLFSIWSDTLEEFCQWIKSQYPDIFIISGSSVNPLFQSHHIDFYIQGFGEHAILDLLRWKLSNGPRPKFNLQKINSRPVINANDLYPAFPMSSLLVEYQDRDFIQPGEWLGIETARGCKFQCDFCNFPVLGVKGDYSRDASDFERQLKHTYDHYGVTNYTIADETFNDRTEKISKFADVVQSLNFKPYFSAYIRLDLMISRKLDREELLRMNVLGHFYGVETFNNKSAKSVNKGMNSELIKQGLIDAKKYFNTNSNNLYRGNIGLMIGLPHETPETLELTRQWLLDNWLQQSYTVYPVSIPYGELEKSSKFSLNYTKYGYREYSGPAKTMEQNKKTHIGIGSILWENDQMDIFQANTIASRWVDQKYKFDFRPGCFTIANKIKNHPSAEERINLKYNELEAGRDHDISDYINSKLNYKI
jgi:radical SAM superfamily enzyme YgiQ (UPF0313 family)